jgi:hypothetical protein
MTDLIGGAPEAVTGPRPGEPTIRPTMLWDWTPDALEAFLKDSGWAGGKLRLKVKQGLNAALAVDAPAIFQQQLDGLVEMLTTHPVLGDRVIVLDAQANGKAYLKVDADLIRYILTDELPEGVRERMRAEAETGSGVADE